ncbi:efflux RND transporter periplasmic adaptor subunit [Mucilaginibacter rubeus]|uniref:Efflux RND transporter periplasmic adaptor subunit n=1 Tax=Mucilaginibacter rubeus TaxID=2027860 RepID=A0A5C1HU84_9SPHI|nr:efflux RND transporter periplasmic adaptor subunit [Mucilaginibacter rubeus]QEM09053.1 efflux RND transporter periplasmic adaptor subunit [Mucilaginibacter rubeus]
MIKIFSISTLVCVAAIILLSGCKQKEKDKPVIIQAAKKSAYYTCSMHPQIHEDHPGDCPICGMKLIKVETAGATTDNRITLTATQLELAGIRTDTVKQENTGSSKNITGIVNSDENASAALGARLPGRIQQLFIRTIGENLNVGQPVYSIYSEELQEAEKEYLLAREQQQKLNNPDMDYQALISAAENKLKLWGLNASQIRNLAHTQKVSATTTILSTISGTVTELNIHEGDYLSEGMTVLKTQSLNSLWVEAQLYSGETGILKQDQQVSVSFPEAGLTLKGKVTFMNPELSDQSKVDLVRISLDNPNGQVRPGMQAYIMTGDGTYNLAVPASAVLTDGKGSHVWVKNKDNTFSSRMVELADGNQRFIKIKSGLTPGEVVVTNGTYLLDSEAIFKNGQAMAGMKM